MSKTLTLSQQSNVSLDIWAYRNERPGHIIAILEVVFGNNGSIAAVIMS